MNDLNAPDKLKAPPGVGSSKWLGNSWVLPIKYVPDLKWKAGMKLLKKLAKLFPPRLFSAIRRHIINRAVIYDNGQTTVWAGATIGLTLEHSDLEWLSTLTTFNSSDDFFFSVHGI